MAWVKKALLVGAVISVVAGGVALIPRRPQTAETAGYRMTLVGYTNTPVNPRGVFSLETPKDGGNCRLWEVRYWEEGDWRPWIAPNQGIQPRDVMYFTVGPKAFTSISVPATNVPLRVVMAIYEEGRGGPVQRIRRWWVEREYERKHWRVDWERMPVYLMTNETSGVAAK